jgi:hypothetical protein
MTQPRTLAPLMLIVFSLALALSACVPGDPTPAGTRTATSVIETDSPVPTPTSTQTDEPVVDTIPADMLANIHDAVSSGNSAALEGYLAPSVHVTYAASEAEGDVTNPTIVLDDLAAVTSPTATWDWTLPAATIDNYRNNPGSSGAYVDDFPEGAVVGRSSEARVVSIVVADGLITRVFIANDEYALTFE